MAVTVVVPAVDWRPWRQEEGGGPGSLEVVAGVGGHGMQGLTDLQKKPPVQPWLEGGVVHLTLGKERMYKMNCHYEGALNCTSRKKHVF